jgi:hypothetical protein
MIIMKICVSFCCRRRNLNSLRSLRWFNFYFSQFLPCFDSFLSHFSQKTNLFHPFSTNNSCENGTGFPILAARFNIEFNQLMT